MLNAFKSAVSELGLLNGLLYLLGRVFEVLSNGRCRLIRYYLVAQPIPVSFVPTCRPSERERVFEVSREDSVVEAFPRPQQAIVDRFAKHYVCLVATNKDDFAGFLWFARGGYDEDEVHCRFDLAVPAVTVWDFDVYVEQRFRLGRTFARLWDAANERLSSEGVAWSISRISAFNQQSLRSHGRLGTRRLHTLTFVCFGAVQIGFFTCRPYLSLAWGEASRPTLAIYPPQATNSDANPSGIKS